MTLPPFPTDDATLTAIEHALGGAYEVDNDGNHALTGADFSLQQMLDTYAEHDPEDAYLGGYTSDGTPIYICRSPTYTERDVIAALIAEVRRLRS